MSTPLNTPSSGKRQNTLWQIFALPLLIGLLSLIGLTVALLGDGALNLIAWACLAIPVLAVAWAMLKKPGTRRGNPLHK